MRKNRHKVKLSNNVFHLTIADQSHDRRFRKCVVTVATGEWRRYSEEARYYRDDGSSDTQHFTSHLTSLLLKNDGDDRIFSWRSKDSVSIGWQAGTDSREDLVRNPQVWAPESWYGLGVESVDGLTTGSLKLLKLCHTIRGGDYGDMHPQAFMQELLNRGFTPLKLLRLGDYRSDWVYDHDFDPVQAAPTYEQRIAKEAAEAGSEHEEAEIVA